MNKIKLFNKTFVSVSTLALVMGWAAAQADDVEVYLQEPPQRVPPNLMFTLDESGSMSSNDGTPYTRLQDLKSALKTILDDPELGYANAAIVGWTTNTGNDGDLRFRMYSDFVNIDDNRATLKAKVDALTAYSYTPTTKTMEGAVDWFVDGYNAQEYESKNKSKWDKDKTTTALTPIRAVTFDGQANVALYCQPNAIILMTDGQPNSNATDSGKRYGLTSYKGTSCVSNSTSRWQSGRCAKEIAGWAYNNDFQTGSEWDGVQNVKTYTIGFHTDNTARTFLQSISTAGGGNHYDATNAADLVTAFKEIANEMGTSISYTYNAPVIPVNTDNAALSGDRIYLPTFKPSATRFWKGNLKKYRLKTTEVSGQQQVDILDSAGSSVVDENYLFKSTVDYWNGGSADGGEPLVGGAASHMPSGNTRALYSNLSPGDLSATTNRVSKTNGNLTYALMGLADGDDTNKNMLIDWITWIDTHSSWLNDSDPDNDKRVWGMGASLHAQPVKVNYGGGDLVYLPTTEGVVHALKADTGEELWAFMPKEMLQHIKTLELNEGAGIPFYGLDGPSSYYQVGSDKYLAVTERRGDWDPTGNLYVLNVTDRDHPQLAFSISSGGSFIKLGQTWSKPKYVKKITIGGSVKENVLIFGGGYDPDQDDATSGVVDDVGNAIFIVDAKTGAMLYSVSNSGASLNIADMTNSIPSDIVTVDINANGIVDRLYATDVAGRVIRVDLPESGTPSGGIVADINAGASAYRKTFNPIEVGYFSRGGHQFLALLLGTGDRANPVAKNYSDRFYMIKDNAVWAAPAGGYTAIGENDLYDATSTPDKSLSVNGWYINLSGSQKVFSQARLYDYAVMFSTYSGEKANPEHPCEAKPTKGESYFWAVNMLDANAVFAGLDGADTTGDPTLTDRSKVLAIPGMPPSPTLIFPSADASAESLGREVLALVGLEEVTRWPDHFYPISWEEVIDEQ